MTPDAITLNRPVVADPGFHPDTPTDVRVGELVSWASSAAASIKERGCEKYDHYDIAPIVEFFKDGALILTLFPAQVSRDNALAAARIAAGPVKPDLITATLDAHVTRAMTNPATGESWKPGEMQASCDDDGACATGLLTDCLVTMAVYRDGHHEMLQRRYQGHETQGNLVWLGDGDHFVSSSSTQSAGYVPDVLQQAMRQAWSETGVLAKAEADLQQVAEEESLSAHMQYWHQVVAGAKMALLSGAAQGALVAAPDEEVSIMVKASLSQEALNEARNSSLGLIASLLGARLGVE